MSEGGLRGKIRDDYVTDGRDTFFGRLILYGLFVARKKLQWYGEQEGAREVLINI